MLTHTFHLWLGFRVRVRVMGIVRVMSIVRVRSIVRVWGLG